MANLIHGLIFENYYKTFIDLNYKIVTLWAISISSNRLNNLLIVIFLLMLVVVLGAYNVGKTTLVKKFCQDKTPQNVFHTIGI